MKEINLPSGNYIFVEIHNDANYNLGINDNNIAFGDSNSSVNWVKFAFKLPKENKYTIISTTNDITEEQSKDLIKVNGEYATCKESLKQFIQSIGLNKNLNYLILKKI